MRDKILLIGFLLCTLFSGCTAESRTETADTNLLKSFRLYSDGGYHHASIDYESHVANVAGIKYGDTVQDVMYSLADGAEISPDPEEFIGKWPEQQSFTVRKGDEEEVYDVVLQDFAGNSAKKVVFAYMMPFSSNFESVMDSMDWSCITHILPSFCYVNADGTLDSSDIDRYIEQIRDAAHADGVEVVMSFRSKGEFTEAVSTEESREILVNNIIDYVERYDLDGVDIDYEEYEVLEDNIPKLLSFFSLLRSEMPEGHVLTCAMNGGAWLDYGTEWHESFDYVNLMSYGHLDGSGNPCQHSSFELLKTHVARLHEVHGIPYSKILAGMPFYGFTWDEGIPGTDASGAVSFGNIVNYFKAEYPEVVNVDQIKNTYYNGKDTIRKKCGYAKDTGLGGVMIWQLSQDALSDGDKLLDVVGEVMLEDN